MEYHPLKKMI